MTTSHDAPDPSGAGRARPAPTSSVDPTDPIFQGEEPSARATPRSSLVVQFFLFPLLIVVASVGVFLFFGAIGGSEKSGPEWLDVLASGGTNERKQAAHQLGDALRRERGRVERGEIPLAEAFYVKDPYFRSRLLGAFEASFPDGEADRQQFLAAALGFVGDPAYRLPLEARLTPTASQDLRRVLTFALAGISSEDVVPALARLSKDRDEPTRNYAIQGLSRFRTPGANAALEEALADESLFVQANAAAALALLGNPAGKEVLGRLLDPAWVERAIDTPSGSAGAGTVPPGQREALRLTALTNGIRGALALRAADLRPRVAALAQDRDPAVRGAARDVLDQWPDVR